MGILQKKKLWGFFAATIFAAGILGITSQAEEPAEIAAEADAYVRDNGTQDGTGTYMEMKNDASGYVRNALMRFAVPESLDYSGYNNVSLSIYIASVADSASREMALYAVENDWEESSVTWDTAPALLQSEAISEIEVKNTDAGTWLQVDVTDYVMEALAEGTRTFSFKGAVVSAADSKGHFTISTRESENAPLLVFSTRLYEEIEEPVIDTVVAREPELPDTVDVLLYSGETVQSAVVWEEYSNRVQLMTKGSFTLSGTVPEYGATITATINMVLPEVPEGYEGTTYYVDDANGNDDADGTSEETAWKSLDKVNATAFLPGDKILLKAGGIWNGQLWPKGDGTAENPILISSYGEGAKPVINGNGTGAALKQADNRDEYMQYFSGAVQLINQSGWEIEGLEVTNNDTSYNSNRSGILAYCDGSEGNERQEYIHIINCYVHDCYPSTTTNYTDAAKNTGGINILSSPNDNTGYYDSSGALQIGEDYGYAGFSDVLVENCVVKDVAKEGIRNSRGTPVGQESTYMNENIIFRNNYVENVYGDGMVICGVASGTTGLAENNIINTFSKSGAYGQYFAGCWAYVCEDTVLQYNEVYNGENAYGDGEGFDVDRGCQDTVIQYNYSHNNFGGFLLIMPAQYRTIVRYNVSVNDGYGTDSFSGQQQIFDYWNGGGTQSVIPSMYNNTIIVGEGITAELFYGSAALGLDFKNNLIYVEGTLSKVTRNGFSNNSVVENNCFYPLSSFTGTSGWTEEELTEGNNIFENPMLSDADKALENIALAAVAVEDGEMPDLGSFQSLIAGCFSLQEGSPCIDAGQEIEGAPSEDIVGTAIQGQRDIGAVEYIDELHKVLAEAQDKLEEMQSLVEAGQTDYTEDSWDLFIKAYAALQEVSEDTGTEEIRRLIEDLRLAGEALETEEEPVTEEQPATEGEPATEEPATEEPATEEQPATEEEPATEEQSATEEQPSAQQKPAQSNTGTVDAAAIVNASGLAAPSIAGVKVKAGKNGVYAVITVGAVDGADRYEIYRVEKGKAVLAGTTASGKRTFTDKNIKQKSVSYYAVAVSADGSVKSGSGPSKAVKLTNSPKIKKAAKTAAGISLTWKKVSGASKYIVYRSTKKNSGYTKVGTVKKTTYTDKRAKKGRSYYYRIVAVKNGTPGLMGKVSRKVKR